jgi:hypothetical protein
MTKKGATAGTGKKNMLSKWKQLKREC